MNKQVTLVTAASSIATYAYAVAIEDKDNGNSRFSTTKYNENEDFKSILENLLGSFWANIETIEMNIANDHIANTNNQDAAQKQAQADADCIIDDNCTPEQKERNAEKEKKAGADHSHSHYGYGYSDDEDDDRNGLGKESSASGTYSFSDSGRSKFSVSEGTSGTYSTVSSVSIEIQKTAHQLDIDVESFYSSSQMTSDDADPDNTTDPSIQVINPPIDNDGNVVDVDGRKIDGIHWKAGAEANMIFGTSWDDVLEGGAGADTSHGLEGNDLMKGKGGFDNQFGGAGHDVMFSGEMFMGPYDDEAPGYDANNFDPDTSGGYMAGGAGHDSMYGDSGDDKMEGGSGIDVLFGFGGNDWLMGGSHDDEIHGGDGYDNLYGNSGDDYIKGGDKDDNIMGGTGDDFIKAGNGNDSVWGGDGDDTIYGGLLRNNDDLKPNIGNVLRGGRGDDYIVGGGGPSDYTPGMITWIEGNEGDDYIVGAWYQSVQKLWGGDGEDAMYGGSFVTEQFLHGGDDDDIMYSGNYINELSMKGGDGADYMFQEQGTPSVNMDAGRGNDNIEVDNNNAGNPWNPLHESTYNLGPGDDTLDFGTSPTGTAYVIGGSGKDDVQTGASAGGRLYIWGDYEYDAENDDDDIWGDDDNIYIYDNTGFFPDENLLYVWGGDGADRITVEGDNKEEWLHGQNGDDHITYGEGARGIYVYGDDGDDKIDNFDDQTGSWYQEIHGGEGDDNVEAGYAAHSYIFGENGSDTLSSMGSTKGWTGYYKTLNDYIWGGPGEDTINGGTGSYETGCDSGGCYYLGYQWLHGGDDEDEIWGGDKWMRQNIAGEAGNDWIWGGEDIGYRNAQDDGGAYLYGDTMGVVNGYGIELETDGDDMIDVGAENAYVHAYGGGGNDKIFGGDGMNTRQSHNAVNGFELLSGGSGDDKLWAQHPGVTTDNLGAQWMRGDEGNDWLRGSNQDDIMWGDNPMLDAADEQGESGIDWLIGRGGDDYIFGGWGDDYIDGGAGDDWIDGGPGNDVINTGWGNDYVVSGEGEDWVETGPGADTMQGSGAANNQNGGDGPDTMTGMGGADVQSGGDGPDIMMGDGPGSLLPGSDWMEGGNGADSMYGNEWDDVMFGDAGYDYMIDGSGHDKMFGGNGSDEMHAVEGWDNLDGGDHADLLVSYDGGDCLWGGPATYDPEDLSEVNQAETQTFIINGTGLDEENYTIVMDFWREDAVLANELCMQADEEQVQNDENHYPFGTLPYCYSYGFGNGVNDVGPLNKCLNFKDLTSPELTESANAQYIHGLGCHNDQGPLWISIPPVETCTEIVYANLFQLKPGHPALRHTHGQNGYRSRRGGRNARRGGRRNRYAETDAEFLGSGSWGGNWHDTEEIEWNQSWGLTHEQQQEQDALEWWENNFGSTGNGGFGHGGHGGVAPRPHHDFGTDHSHGNDHHHDDHDDNDTDIMDKFGKKSIKGHHEDYPEHYAHGSIACLFNGYDARGIDHGYGDRYSGVTSYSHGQGGSGFGRNRRFAQYDGAYYGYGSHGHDNSAIDHQLSYRSTGVYGGDGGHNYFNSSELQLCLQVELCRTCCYRSGDRSDCNNYDFEE